LVLAGDLSPDLAYMQELYRGHFEEATRQALRALTPRERTVLRLHLAERRTLHQLGAIYDVSHATAARWLAAAREKLVDGVRRTLMERLSLSPSEFESVAALVRSQIDVRVVDLLRSTSAASGA
jgi:RNA polymerase sigma-70 factor (ECF subfamily)